MTQYAFLNNYSDTLTADSIAADTFLDVTDSSEVVTAMSAASGKDIFLTLVRASDGLIEIVLATSATGTTIEVFRGQEGTTALDFITGDGVEARLTAKALTELGNEAFSADSVTGVDLTSGFTGIGLSNSTYNASVNVGATSNAGSAYTTVVGHQGNAQANGGIVLGSYAYSNGSYNIAMGVSINNTLNDTMKVRGFPVVHSTGGTEFVVYSAVNLTSVFTYTMKTLAGTAFITEIGYIVKSGTITTNPTFTVGISGTLAKYLASTTPTLTAAGIQTYSPIADTTPMTATTARIDVTTGATGTSLLGGFYIKGIMIE